MEVEYAPQNTFLFQPYGLFHSGPDYPIELVNYLQRKKIMKIVETIIYYFNKP